jgi:hypothetical protein
MKRMALGWLVSGALSLAPALSGAEVPDPGEGLFIVKSTARTPDEVVAAIEAYAKANKWQFVGATPVKNGEVTLVKVCIPAVGKLLWPLGLRLSAMLPCGNVGVYSQKGTTEISVLHPAYMQVLYPNPTVEQAAGVATPLMMDMLDKVAQ